MPRQARLIILNAPHHITHRSNTRENIFCCKNDFVTYIKLIEKGLERETLELNAFCIMSNHVHFILTPYAPEALSRFMAFIQQNYAKYFNAVRVREGHLWKERFYSCPIEETWLDCAYHYVIDNPVRAGIVKNPKDYRWSSIGMGQDMKVDYPHLDMNSRSQQMRKFTLEGIEQFKKTTRSGRLFEGTECHVT